MTALLQGIEDRQRVIQAIEENTAEFLLSMGKAGGAIEKRSEVISWTIGGSPIDYHNAVVYANLSPETADQAIRGVTQLFQTYKVPGTWHLTPSMKPANLAERLQNQGFTFGGYEPAMALFLPSLPSQPMLKQGLSIERVRDEQTLTTWANTLATDFGEGQKEADWVASVYRKIGMNDAVPWRHYLAWLDGVPVATSSMFMGAGVVGIYFVQTVPQARSQGIGKAITLAALNDAHKMGYKVAVLGSSEAGFPLYTRLGFETYFQFELYEWKPLNP